MTLFFSVLAFVLTASAIGVATMRSPVHCALLLLTHLIGIAVLFATLHAHFLAAAQIMVYAGAVVVLVIFVILLLNLRAEIQARFPYLFLAIGGVVFAIFILAVAPALDDALGGWERTGFAVEGTVRNVGTLLYSRYFFIFQAAGLLLLAATVGSVMTARSRKTSVPGKEESNASS